VDEGEEEEGVRKAKRRRGEDSLNNHLLPKKHFSSLSTLPSSYYITAEEPVKIPTFPVA